MPELAQWGSLKATPEFLMTMEPAIRSQKLSYCLASQQNENTNFNFVSSICDINKLLVAESCSPAGLNDWL